MDAITGNSFGFAIPESDIEDFVSTIFMALGAAFLAMVFADFESLMNLTRSESIEKNKLYNEAKDYSGGIH